MAQDLQILDPAGKSLGAVAEIMFDMISGRVIAVSLLIAGSHRIVIPWADIRFDTATNCLRVVEPPSASLATVN